MLIVSLLDGRVVKVYPSDDGLVGNGIVEEIVPKSSSSRPLGCFYSYLLFSYNLKQMNK